MSGAPFDLLDIDSDEQFNRAEVNRGFMSEPLLMYQCFQSEPAMSLRGGVLRITLVERDIAGHLHSFLSAGRSVQTPPYRFRLSARCRDMVRHVVGIVGATNNGRLLSLYFGMLGISMEPVS